MRTIMFSVFFLIAASSRAQRDCVTSEYTERQRSLDPSFSSKQTDIEQFIQAHKALPQAKENGGDVNSIVRIPVVVHVLYNTASQNISDEQVLSQIQALNRDFRRQNTDTLNTPDRFRSIAADVQVEFALATADPQGRATNGIVRRQTSVTDWKMDDKIKYASEGGDDIWDSRYYLNIWVGNLRSLLGYSSTPGTAADKDGVVISYTAFGTLQTSGPYNLGRTATHEIGHWLGLRHIWGDTYCGDDAVEDTPKQGNFTSGCPTGFRSSCSNGTQGDMYMNYMDFTSDACMNLFTTGQKERMLALFRPGGPRALLQTSKGLNEPWNHEPVTTVIASGNSLKLFPNPVSSEVVLNVEQEGEWKSSVVRIMSMDGRTVSTIQLNAKIQKISVMQLKPGMYFITVQNGTQRLTEKFIKL